MQNRPNQEHRRHQTIQTVLFRQKELSQLCAGHCGHEHVPADRRSAPSDLGRRIQFQNRPLSGAHCGDRAENGEEKSNCIK